MNGGRKDWNVYGDKNGIIAPIGEYADYFNLSGSDMLQVMDSEEMLRKIKL